MVRAVFTGRLASRIWSCLV